MMTPTTGATAAVSCPQPVAGMHVFEVTWSEQDQGARWRTAKERASQRVHSFSCCATNVIQMSWREQGLMGAKIPSQMALRSIIKCSKCCTQQICPTGCKFGIEMTSLIANTSC